MHTHAHLNKHASLTSAAYVMQHWVQELCLNGQRRGHCVGRLCVCHRLTHLILYYQVKNRDRYLSLFVYVHSSYYLMDVVSLNICVLKIGVQ